MNVFRIAVLSSCLLVATACRDRSFERQFFKRPLADRVERARQLGLEDQYKIFRYGNDVVHPPLMDLAGPIAERGKEAVPFLLAKLAEDPEDIGIRDSLVLFERMALSKSYDVKSDPVVMNALTARVANMKDKGWQVVCRRMLDGLRDL